MEETRLKLIALLMGDLPPADAAKLEARIAGDERLQQQHSVLRRTIGLVRAVPSEDASEALVSRLLLAADTVPIDVHAEPVVVEDDNVIRVNWLLHRVLPRVAAVAAIIFIFGLGVSLTPTGLPDDVAEVTDGGVRDVVLDGEPVESRVGETRRIKFATGEVLLGGASTVRVYRKGEFQPPTIEVERGRAVITAATAGLTVHVADRSVTLEEGGMLSVSYDRAYANISLDRSVVEVQRMRIGEVAALAQEAYGVKLDAGAVPPAVRDNRVTFYGSNLSADEFLDSFVEAAAGFGIKLDETRRYLAYQPLPGRIQANDEWQLEVALLKGRAAVEAPGHTERMDAGSANFVSVSSAGTQRSERAGRDELNRQVVWAAGTSGELATHLLDVRASDAGLPDGTVIHSDRLVLFGEIGKRIYKLGASEFDYVLPGGRKGRVVQLTSSGAVFEVQGEFVREFVPFSEQ